MRSLATLLLAAFLCSFARTPANALPKFYAVFRQTYALKAGTPLAQAKCLTCHASSGPPERNPYGLLVQKTLRAQNARELTASLLHKIEPADSDGDGWTNGDEITAGTLPGDPKSHPQKVAGPSLAGSTSAGTSGAADRPADETPGLQRMLMPKHSFHPIIVHFALALFVFGGLLEIYGLIKRRQVLREAGFLNMTAASIAGLLAVTTGVIAAYRNGFPFKGTLLIHLVLGTTAAVGMAASAYVGYRAARKGRERSSRFYWVLVVLALVAVLSAAFFGGEFVYTDLMGM